MKNIITILAIPAFLLIGISLAKADTKSPMPSPLTTNTQLKPSYDPAKVKEALDAYEIAHNTHYTDLSNENQPPRPTYGRYGGSFIGFDGIGSYGGAFYGPTK